MAYPTGIEKDILIKLFQISNDLLNHYTTTQDRLLWLIFIPHVLLAVFIWVFADNAGRALGPAQTNPGIRNLTAIAVYITIIFTGWYGTWVVPIFTALWQIIIIVALGTFILSRFIHPARVKELTAWGAMKGQQLTAKPKARKQLEKQAEGIRKMIAALNSQPTSTAEARQYKEMQLAQLRMQLAELEHEISEL